MQCADLGMTNLVIILVMLMGTKSAGWQKDFENAEEDYCTKAVTAALDVIMSMDTATFPDNANGVMDMKVHFVINVSDIQDAKMANVMNLGLAIVKKAGVQGMTYYVKFIIFEKDC